MSTYNSNQKSGSPQQQQSPINSIIHNNNNQSYDCLNNNNSMYITQNNFNQYQNNVQWKEVYSSQLPITIKENQKDQIKTFVDLNIQLRLNHKQGQKMKFQLSDESNHLFLFESELNEQQYLELKQEQQLRCDFQGFPVKIDELIDITMNHIKDDQENIEYECRLNVQESGEAEFSINEINNFRVLARIKINFQAADDETLKLQLANRLSNEISKNEDLRIQNQKFINQLDQKNQEFDIATKQIHQELTQKIHQIDQIKLQKEELNKKYEQQQKNEKNRQKEQLSSVENTLKGQINDLILELSEFREKIEQLQKRDKQNVAENNKLQGQITDLKTDLQIKQKLNQELENTNQELESIRQVQIRNLNENSITIEGLNNQLLDKQALVDESHNLKNILIGDKKQLEQRNQELQDLNTRLEKNNSELQQEIKARMEKVSELKQNIEEKDNNSYEQKQKQQDQKQEIEALLKQIESLKSETQQQTTNLENEICKTNSEQEINKDLKKQLEQSQKILKENQALIQYLNEKMNEYLRPAKTYGSNNKNSTMRGLSSQNSLRQTQNVPFSYDSFKQGYQDQQYTKSYKGYINSKLQEQVCSHNPNNEFHKASCKYCQEDQEKYRETMGKIKYQRPVSSQNHIKIEQQ